MGTRSIPSGLPKPLTAALCALALAAACNARAPDDADPAPSTAPAAVAVNAPAPPETAKSASPALWKTGDADTTVYLFGTVHILPKDLEWRTQAIDQAFSEASAVYFETDLDPNPVDMTALIARLGLYPPGERLSQKLSGLDLAALNEAAEELDVPVANLDRMRPWLAATTLSQRLIIKAGFDPLSGVERTLAPMATADGKIIRRLETIEDQLMIFAKLSEETQLRYLLEGLHNAEEETLLLRDLVEAWRTGDVDALNRIMIEEEMADQKDVYDALLVRRNRNWTTQLDQLIESEPGVFFVAVGAAHLAGKDSVVEMLAAENRVSQRLQ
jgi:uncharacterized protein YbaP (TraB family)